MTQVEGIPYRRHGPSAALREFLDPLDPGDYFDCGRARLHGLDDALLEEARHRGRTVGDDSFQLVATDMGLIFCRPSISFAIAARWEEVTLIRPRGGDPVVLPITWPRHGELKFTVSKRLAGNIFRRWLQLRMLAARRARRGHSDRFSRQELRRPADEPVLTGGHRIDLQALDGPDSVDVDPQPDPTGGPDAATTGPDADPDPDSGTRPGSAESSVAARPTGPTGPVAPAPTLDDRELERVAVPRPNTTPTSWIGSALSMAMALVVLSSLVLIVAVSVGVYRRAVLDGEIPAPAAPVAADDIGRVTIDHRRFSPTADPSGSLDGDEGDGASGAVLTPIGAGPSGSSPASGSSPSSGSAAGGAAADDDSSTQGRLQGDHAPSGEVEQCNRNYGGCVPDVGAAAAEVDCAGQGDGPYFVDGEVLVMGEDVYGLDTDGDGTACDPDQPATGQPATAEPDEPDEPVESPGSPGLP